MRPKIFNRITFFNKPNERLTEYIYLQHVKFCFTNAFSLRKKSLLIPVTPRQVGCSDQHEAAHPALGGQVAVLGVALGAVVAPGAEARHVVQVAHAHRRLGVGVHLVGEAHFDEGVVHVGRCRGRLQLLSNEFAEVDIVEGDGK